MKSGNLNFLETSGPLQACNGTALPLPLPLPLRHRAQSKVLNNILFSIGLMKVLDIMIGLTIYHLKMVNRYTHLVSWSCLPSSGSNSQRRPLRWKNYASSKCQQLLSSPNGVTFQKNWIFKNEELENSNRTNFGLQKITEICWPDECLSVPIKKNSRIFYDARAPQWDPGPPNYRGFTITLRHTKFGRIPLDE
jgi:hypothetical protein